MLALMFAAAVPNAPLLPTGPWNVEAEEDMCVLSRPYGSPPDGFVIGFQPIFNEARMDFVIVSKGKKGQQETGTATIERAPDGRTFRGSFVGLGTSVGGKYLLRISVDRALFDELGQTAALRIKAGSKSQYVRIVNFDKAKPVFQSASVNCCTVGASIPLR